MTLLRPVYRKHSGLFCYLTLLHYECYNTSMENKEKGMIVGDIISVVCIVLGIWIIKTSLVMLIK